jgi:PST family polysaccharide transporter
MDAPPASAGDGRDAHFDTSEVRDDLRPRSLRAGVVTFVGQPVKLALQIGSTMVLARLLTPHDMGLVGMVSLSVMAFLDAFKDAGLVTATVQSAGLTHAQVSTLFAVNAGISLALGVIAAALAPAVAWFYDEPRLVGVGLALAPTLFIGGLALQHRAILMRQMRFGALVGLDVGSLALGVAVGAVLAWRGAAYWSLVGMTLATTVSAAALAWMLCDWRPGWPARGTGVRPLLLFGGRLTAFAFCDFLYRNLANVLVGRFWGASALGQYSQANRLLLLPVGQVAAPIGSVAVPALSRLAAEPEQYRDAYLVAVRVSAWLFLPVVAALLVATSAVVAVLFGPQWGDVVPLFRLLGVGALFIPLAHSTGWLFVSSGRTDSMLRWGIVATAISSSALLAAAPFGTRAVALAAGLSGAVLGPAAVWYATRGTPIRMVSVLAAVRWPALTAATAAATFLGAVRLLQPSTPVANLAVLAATFAGVTAVGLAASGEWRTVRAGLRP